MTEDEKVEAHDLQGSLVGLGDNVTDDATELSPLACNAILGDESAGDETPLDEEVVPEETESPSGATALSVLFFAPLTLVYALAVYL